MSISFSIIMHLSIIFIKKTHLKHFYNLWKNLIFQKYLFLYSFNNFSLNSELIIIITLFKRQKKEIMTVVLLFRDKSNLLNLLSLVH